MVSPKMGGYWTSERFMHHIDRAVEIAEFKYPKTEGWRHAWVFDHSTCHAVMATDSLDVSYMNVKPDGKQRKMHDTTYKRKVYTMNFCDGSPKGMKRVLLERDIDTTGMRGDDMKRIPFPTL